MRGPTFSVWAPCCTKWLPANRHFPERLPQRYLQRSSPTNRRGPPVVSTTSYIGHWQKFATSAIERWTSSQQTCSGFGSDRRVFRIVSCPPEKHPCRGVQSSAGRALSRRVPG